MIQSPHLRPVTALRPLTTAHLAQTMTLLEMNAAELDQKIEADLASNPALEIKDTRCCPQCRRPSLESGLCPRCNASNNLSKDEPIIFVSPRQDFYRPGVPIQEDLPEDNLPQITEDLPTYVLRQIAPELPPNDRRLAAYILSNLDEDGLLEVPLVEVSRYHHVPLSRVEAVLGLIQRADPVGVGSPSRQVEQLAHFISDNLNPFPGRAYWGDIRQGKGDSPPVYTFPDVVITPLTESLEPILVVEVVSPYAGMLRINPLFRQALNQAPSDRADQWRSDLEHAELLVKCLQQRTHTVVRLIARIVVLQREYILHGDEYLQPLTRASLADELLLHESTISRAVASKTVQLPNGHIVPLAKFFDRSLNVRTALKQIIAQETNPLSDSQIVGLLKCLGYSVARRTVAKYRAMEGILPSHLRQNHQMHENS